LSRGDLTYEQWHILDRLLPDRGERGPAIESKRRTVNGILWVLRTGAPWRDMPERYGNWNSVFVAVHPLEQARRVGRSIRNAGESGASSRRGACHRFHDQAGAPTCGRRKRGNQNQQALGGSRGGFSSKMHLRTNAKEPSQLYGWRRQLCTRPQPVSDFAPVRIAADPTLSAITRSASKKTLYAAEQKRAEVACERRPWMRGGVAPKFIQRQLESGRPRCPLGR
jgi:transposase